MKFLFALLTVILIGLGVGTYLSYPDLRSTVPVIYWVTDPNPLRTIQIQGFQDWQIQNHRGEKIEITTLKALDDFRKRNWSDPQRQAMTKFNERGDKLFDPNTAESDLPLTVWLPACDLRLDSANNDPSKKVIQGVSGVGGEVWDCYGSGQLRYFQAIGLMTDLTEAGKEMGFDVSHTWPAIRPDLTIDDEQYGFPCNVSVNMLWVNQKMFKDVGMQPPPRRWNFDEFEAIGKELVGKLNKPDQRDRVFFCMSLELPMMYQSMGLSTYDETMTRCTLDDPRVVECLKRIYKWTYEDHLMPSLADQASFNTQSSFGGASVQLFNADKMAMFMSGRWMLITLRKLNEQRKINGEPYLDLSVSEPPNGGFPYTIIYTRVAGIYIMAKDSLPAKLFATYLASDVYNKQIIEFADALPPDPSYTQSELFSRPPAHSEEWGVHEPFANAARTIAIAGTYSPYVLESVATRIIKDAQDGYMANRLTAEQAAKQAADRINEEIQRTLKEQPKLMEHYKELLERQKKIDRMRAEGEPIPASWIDNTFYRRYYAEKGWMAHE